MNPLVMIAIVKQIASNFEPLAPPAPSPVVEQSQQEISDGLSQQNMDQE